MEENKGVIAGLNQERGFGFIKIEGRVKDLFFHAQQVNGDTDFKTLKKGDEVFFDGVEPTHKGDQAYGVRLA